MSPARWRKAKNPEAGGRWDTPMNRMVWNRDHGQDVELTRGGVVLATVSPGGGWVVHGASSVRGRESDVEKAKARVRAVIRERDAQAPTGRQGGK